MSSVDRRVAPRLDAIELHALVGDPKFSDTIDCVVINFSKSGCRLILPNGQQPPDDVVVKIDGITNPIPGRVVWRGAGEVGIEFQQAKSECNGRRRERRIEVSLVAVASDPSKTVTIDCDIRDASKSGCRIKSGQVHVLPDRILLKIEAFKQWVGARVMWRSSDMAGLRFDWAAKSALPARRKKKASDIVDAKVLDIVHI